MSDVIQSTGVFISFVDDGNIIRKVVKVPMLDGYWRYNIEHLDTSKLVSGDQVRVFRSGAPLYQVIGICGLNSTWAGEWRDLEEFLS